MTTVIKNPVLGSLLVGVMMIYFFIQGKNMKEMIQQNFPDKFIAWRRFDL